MSQSKSSPNKLSPSAIVNFIACEHLAALDKAAAAGALSRPHFPDPAGERLAKLGLEHEQRFLDQLRANLPADQVITIDTDAPWPDAAQATRAAMQAGAAVIYQGTFFSPPYLGRADFLCRVERPSGLGAWSYEAVDTKLARQAKASALLQLCFYSEQLAVLQGVTPELMHIELGAGRGRASFRVASFAAYFRQVRAQFAERFQALDHTISAPEPTERCGVCDWASRCDAQWRRDDHLSLVAGISRNQRSALTGAGIETVAKLAALAENQKPPELDRTAFARVQRQAELQVRGRDEGQLLYELNDETADGLGLAALPPPSPGDVFFDIEGDPFAEGDGLDYLLGVVTTNEGERYEPIWAFDRAEEKRAFERFVDFIEARRSAYPDLHIYHYAPYEPTAMKRLAGRHNTRVDAIDAWARGGLFVDLYRVVRQGLRASVESYSLKKIEALCGFTRSVALRDANSCLTAFEAWLASGDGASSERGILDTIAGYNQDDCVSTLRLRDWLEERRSELERHLGRALPRPSPQPSEPSAELGDKLAQLRALYASLIEGLSADEAQRDANEQARWLLAQLLEWHRREEKSFWWEYFHLRELGPDELIEDRTALGGLVYVGEVGKVKRSTLHRYRYPEQDHALALEDSPHDVLTGKAAGTVAAIDAEHRTIDLRRGNTSETPHPSALIPAERFAAEAQQEAIAALARWVLEHSIDAPGFGRAARDLLLRTPPRLTGGVRLQRGAAESTVDQAVRVGLALKGGVLAIQGPPGAGKTFTGARMILALVQAGKKVGVLANSHRVVSNLLDAVCKEAVRQGRAPRIAQKAPDGERCEHPLVRPLYKESNAAVATLLDDGAISVIGGTSWLFAHEAMRETLDVLVVDEAGQMALPNAIAASLSAESLVLLGDPRQLEQPLKGTHPPGAGVSALGHLLGAEATLPDDRGIFLPETRRMHPEVCRYISETFYDGRLGAHASTAQQRIEGVPALGQTGLRLVTVEHRGNQSESTEEAAAVAKLVQQLTAAGARWTDGGGVSHPLTLADILIVAAYNAQVTRLRDVLPEGARIGTVDKFQGQEGAVAIYSMATSSPQDAPRGMEFLYSPNRLNVAISRAKCMAVLVASPAHFHAECKTPRQMQLANGLCALREYCAAS